VTTNGGPQRPAVRRREETDVELTEKQDLPAAARPALAPGVQLVGELPDTAFVDRQWLVQRDGQFIQVTELLYRILEHANGERTLDEIADGVTQATEWLVSGEQVRQLIEAKLLPLGVMAQDGAATAATPDLPRRESPSPLAVNMRVKVVGPRVLDPLTRVLQYLFWPPVVAAALALGAAAHLWLYRERGLLGAFIDALYTPGVLLILLGLVLLSAIFHELGHASGLRYGGGRARALGVGFYAVFPVFFTDATDSYRLGRWARVRTGLGGVYFHLLFALAVMGVALATGEEYLLLVVLLINLEIVHQFIPLMRLDGYWVLTDLTGIPDFFSQTVPFARSLAPGRFGEGTRLPKLRPWARNVFIGYLALTIPGLAVLLFLLVKRLPTILTVAWDAIGTHVAIIWDAAQDRDWLTFATSLSQILILGLAMLGIAYLLYTLAWRPLRAALRHSNPRVRLAGVAALTAAIAVVGFLWAPQMPFASRTPPAGVKTFAVDDGRHVRGPVSYPQAPPVGGAHDPVWQDCGFYNRPVRDENAVHSLEHGAVWITYRPGLAHDDVQALRKLAESEDHVLVSPYPGLDHPVVASAWGRQLEMGSVEDARLDRFVHAFRKASSAPEAGGPCSGGKDAAR
jgi:putative peptide zinc metalloprotease protein